MTRDEIRVLEATSSEIERELTDYEKQVALAYADGIDIIPFDVTSKIRNLHWQGEFLSRDDALAALPIIGEYNDFDTEKVAEELRRQIPPEAEIALAREHSVAMYVRVPDDGVVSLRKMQDATMCQEINYDENGVIRLWWD